MCGIFKQALSPNMHNLGAKMPSSSLRISDIPSNARQSDNVLDPGEKDRYVKNPSPNVTDGLFNNFPKGL